MLAAGSEARRRGCGARPLIDGIGAAGCAKWSSRGQRPLRIVRCAPSPPLGVVFPLAVPPRPARSAAPAPTTPAPAGARPQDPRRHILGQRVDDPRRLPQVEHRPRRQRRHRPLHPSPEERLTLRHLRLKLPCPAFSTAPASTRPPDLVSKCTRPPAWTYTSVTAPIPQSRDLLRSQRPHHRLQVMTRLLLTRRRPKPPVALAPSS